MTAKQPANVAVLGLGIMGTAIATNLEQDGLLAATWNRSNKPGFPKFRDSISDAVRAFQGLQLTGGGLLTPG